MPELAAKYAHPGQTRPAVGSSSASTGAAGLISSGSLGLTGWPPASPAVLVAPLLASGFSEWDTVIHLVRLWDAQMGWRITDLNATSLRITFSPVVGLDVVPSAMSALDDLAQWTDLPTERLGYLVRASRRSIYNWRRGSNVPAETAARILRVHELLQPLATRRPPAIIRGWLADGEPSAVELAHEQNWVDFGRLIEEEIKAKVARPPLPPGRDDEGLEPLAFSQATRREILSRFRSSSTLAPRRADWQPREVTGLGDEETDDDA